MRLRRLYHNGWVFLGLTLVLPGCEPDSNVTTPETALQEPSRPMATTECIGTQKPGGSAEGEVYGNFYEDGIRSCSTYPVELQPYADAQGRLHFASYNPALVADPIWVQAFEWWDPLAGAPCANGTLANYVSNGAATSERAHAPTAPKEGHCVRPGRYAFDGGGRSFDVEYIQPSGSAAANTHTGINEAIEITAYNASVNLWQDLVINTDITSTHPGDTPVLDIQNAGATPYSGTFTNQASPSGTKNDWFRFSAARSTSGWTVSGHGTALARLYWDGTDLSQSTPYYDHKPEGVPVLRLHRFPNPLTASKVYTVGLELLRPDEDPANAASVTRTITINRVNPDLAPGTITMAASVTAGSTFTATLQEKNLLGTADIEAGWIGRLYLSTDQTLNLGSDPVGGTFTETVVIGPSATRTVGRTVTVPGNLTPGLYYVLARLDTSNYILESNESNNTGSSAARIQVNAPPPLVTTINYGPSSVRPNVNCEWMAEASGGIAPYTWVWKVNGNVVPSSDNDIYYTNTGSSFTLRVEVTDAIGTLAFYNKSITVSAGAPYCNL